MPCQRFGRRGAVSHFALVVFTMIRFLIVPKARHWSQFSCLHDPIFGMCIGRGRRPHFRLLVISDRLNLVLEDCYWLLYRAARAPGQRRLTQPRSGFHAQGATWHLQISSVSRCTRTSFCYLSSPRNSPCPTQDYTCRQARHGDIFPFDTSAF